ncbi:hypothetical protein AIOGIFDO_01668 [Candidatus Methanoperedenaceae archaeon GB37]|nr:hypothetical protein AIOGIFDO_01668 [Candidatus Methanoperedenaceae archaeon GB37]
MLIVAVCDEDIIGQCFREGDLQLEVHRDFYEGEPATIDMVISALADADSANIVGERSIRCAVASGFIDPKEIITIGGVPHAQMVRI